MLDLFKPYYYNKDRLYEESLSLTHKKQEVQKMINVICTRKTEAKSKNGKNLYFVDLLNIEDGQVYKAMTTKRHYDALKEHNEFLDNPEFLKIMTSGYINFNNGFTNFYLPKEDLI